MVTTDVDPITLPSTHPVAGVARRQHAVRTVAEGDPVLVVHEPDNPVDGSAMAVLHPDAGPLGYLPAAVAPRALAALSDASGRQPPVDVALAGTVSQVLAGAQATGLRIRLHRAQALPVVRSSSGAELGWLISRPSGRTLRVATSSGARRHAAVGARVSNGDAAPRG